MNVIFDEPRKEDFKTTQNTPGLLLESHIVTKVVTVTIKTVPQNLPTDNR